MPANGSTGALEPPPPAGQPRSARIQFPAGLALVREARPAEARADARRGVGSHPAFGRGGERVLLSWGANDQETMLSHMLLSTLLGGLSTLQ